MVEKSLSKPLSNFTKHPEEDELLTRVVGNPIHIFKLTFRTVVMLELLLENIHDEEGMMKRLGQTKNVHLNDIFNPLDLESWSALTTFVESVERSEVWPKIVDLEGTSIALSRFSNTRVGMFPLSAPILSAIHFRIMSTYRLDPREMAKGILGESIRRHHK